MNFVQNFPCFSIMICLFAGIISSAVSSKAAKYINITVLLVVSAMSAAVCSFTIQTGTSFVYVMGRFPAPWGNELRAGCLEGFMALFFCIIMLLSLLGGRVQLEKDVAIERQKLYYVLINLLLSSLLALIYTNDLFTAYVFVEINTISACGLIMIRQNGHTIEAATRYMIMSLLGSGLLLLGICFLYDITGHLLMSNIKEQVETIAATGEYHVPLIVALGLMSVGLAIKSALYPFHAWLPDAYGYSTVSSAAILSSLVSKGYIFLVVKIFYRVIGFQVVCQSKVINVLFVFGVMGMIMGSLSAIKENDLRRMVAYSSVAQIGYIYMGFGLGTELGVIASVYHVLSHAATKSLLFISAAGITEVSGNSKHFQDLTGAGYRNKLAGVAFSIGSMSMVGIPMFSGFISKLLFSQAAMGHTIKMLPTLIALAISTILNAVYFMKTVIRIYSPAPMLDETKNNSIGLMEGKTITIKEQPKMAVALLLLIILNFVLGLNSEPIIELIQNGIEMFG